MVRCTWILLRLQSHLSQQDAARRKVVSVIERGMKQVVCTYEASDNFGFAVPDNTRFGTDIFIPKERSKGAMSGHKVVVEITSYGKRAKSRRARLLK